MLLRWQLNEEQQEVEVASKGRLSRLLTFPNVYFPLPVEFRAYSRDSLKQGYLNGQSVLKLLTRLDRVRSNILFSTGEFCRVIFVNFVETIDVTWCINY